MTGTSVIALNSEHSCRRLSSLYACMRACMHVCAFVCLLMIAGSNESVKTDCNLFTLAKLHRHIYHSTSVPLLPGYSRVLTPWSSVLHNWQSESWTQPGNPSICLDDGSGRFPNMTHSISNLTLNPAPGEEFSLDFRPADELLNDAMEAVLEVKASKKAWTLSSRSPSFSLQYAWK